MRVLSGALGVPSAMASTRLAILRSIAAMAVGAARAVMVASRVRSRQVAWWASTKAATSAAGIS